MKRWINRRGLHIDTSVIRRILIPVFFFHMILDFEFEMPNLGIHITFLTKRSATPPAMVRIGIVCIGIVRVVMIRIVTVGAASIRTSSITNAVTQFLCCVRKPPDFLISLADSWDGMRSYWYESVMTRITTVITVIAVITVIILIIMPIIITMIIVPLTALSACITTPFWIQQVLLHPMVGIHIVNGNVGVVIIRWMSKAPWIVALAIMMFMFMFKLTLLLLKWMEIRIQH
mmetsp:Transcript_18999/g.34405  ORF Transcript_18999/g.34405 Transcript_18999/m.34405 type:complete len:231 (-) Transcript_18999:76-768(-)